MVSCFLFLLFALTPGDQPPVGAPFVSGGYEAVETSNDGLVVSPSAAKQFAFFRIQFGLDAGREARVVVINGSGEEIASTLAAAGEEASQRTLWWRGRDTDGIVADTGRHFVVVEVKNEVSRVSPIFLLPEWSVPGGIEDEAYLLQFALFDSLVLCYNNKDIELYSSILDDDFLHTIYLPDTQQSMQWGRSEEVPLVGSLFRAAQIATIELRFELGRPVQEVLLNDSGTENTLHFPVSRKTVFHFLSGNVTTEIGEEDVFTLVQRGGHWKLRAISEGAKEP